MIRYNCFPRFHFDENAAGAGGAAGSDAAAAAVAAAASAGAAKAWHDGTAPETLGFWQNKGLDVTNPRALAEKLTEQYRAAERFIGVPPDQVLRIAKADAKPEEIAAMWQRLGAPSDPKDYDFSGVKFAGNDLEPAFADAMRQGLAAAFVPKDKASAIVASVVKYLESADSTESTVNSAKLAEEKAALTKNWADKYDYNHLQAMEGARRLGISPDAVKALENQIGYAALMESMRKIGANTREDTFVERGASGQGEVTTREGAMSRKQELMSDPGWADRYLKGGQTEKREMDRINMMIDGDA
jgi:hypothetical protein